ncbi:c-type cytochrome [Mucilaginibacter sp.]
MKAKIIGIICLLAFFAIIYSCQNDASIEYGRYYSGGAVVYETHCLNCHGDKGQGLNALIPPITDTLLLKDRNKLSCRLKNGISGKITVAGKEFEGAMPASGLSPIELAQVITYVTNSFGNKQGLFTDDQVQTALNNCSK